MAFGEIDIMKMTAGCLCGEIRFEADANPIMAGLCYCTDCQQVSGSVMTTVSPKRVFKGVLEDSNSAIL